MIIDHVDNMSLYKGLSKSLDKALEYIKNTDFSDMSGEYEIEGREIFAIVNRYKTKDQIECKLEGHRKYIDVQYMVSGKEGMGYAPLADQEVATSYDDDKDLIFFEGDASFTRFEKNMFTILHPNDLHMPGVGAGEEVLKVVVKVKAT
ncbi:MAG: DUF386 domain-containing protein [Desulfobacterales bacterium]|nr:DUF386 domain-containing protein [Desulfobacterales bacterium]MCP4161823.1 DUF386 domain-containing protein [Deltaproteobacteria bacterium]